MVAALTQNHTAEKQQHTLLASVIVFILLCGITALIAFTYFGHSDATTKPTPYFKLKLFDDNEFQLRDHGGKPILISFFASWCLPCTEEAPVINQAYDEYKPKGVTFLAIAVSDKEQDARQFVLKHNLSFPAGLDNSGKISKAFGISGLPTIVFIGKDGMTHRIHSGGVTARFLKHELDGLL